MAGKHNLMNGMETESQTIYVLRRFVIDRNGGKRSRYYPQYTVSQDLSAFCTSLEIAEGKLREMIAENNECKKPLRSSIFCFYISEFAVDYPIYERNSDFAKSVRVYDANGNLIERTLCVGYWHPAPTLLEETYFMGRNAENTRFKKGDIVEVLHGEQVRLAIVVSQPLTEEFCRNYNNRINSHSTDEDEEPIFYTDTYDIDSSEDTYIVIDGPDYSCHSHVDSMRLFAPHYTVPSTIRERLLRYYEKVMNEIDTTKQEKGKCTFEE